MNYIRHATKDPVRVHTFYVPARTSLLVGEYAIKRVTRKNKLSITIQWFCNCDDFYHRRLHTGGYCKHIRTVVDFIAEHGGISKFPRGTQVRIPDEEGSNNA